MVHQYTSFCYLILFLISRVNDKYFSLLLVLFVVLGLSFQLVFPGSPLPVINDRVGRGLTAFFGGILFSLYENKLRKINPIILLVIALGTEALMHFTRTYLTVQFVFLVCPAILLLCRRISFDKLKCRSAFSYLSIISFDTYCWHVFLITVLTEIHLNYNSIPIMLGYIILAFIIGFLSYHFIEKPIKRRLLQSHHRL